MFKRFCCALSLATYIALAGTATAAETLDGASLTFQYRDGKFGDEFIEWVAKHGARTPLMMEAPARLDDLIMKLCGEVSADNRQLFYKALEIQNVVVGTNGEVDQIGELKLPPCLPTPKASLAPRVVLPGDSFGKYYDEGENSKLRPLKFEIKDVLTVSGSDLVTVSRPRQMSTMTGIRMTRPKCNAAPKNCFTGRPTGAARSAK